MIKCMGYRYGQGHRVAKKCSDVYDANTRLISYQGSPHCENNNIDISQTYQQQTTHEQIQGKSKLAVASS